MLKFITNKHYKLNGDPTVFRIIDEDESNVGFIDKYSDGSVSFDVARTRDGVLLEIEDLEEIILKMREVRADDGL